MQNITSVAGLKNAIQLLEVEHAVNGKLLKEQFHITYESLRPVNLFRSALSDVVSSPRLIDNILNIAMVIVTGYFSKKVVAGASINKFRKFIGSVLQVGVTNFIAQHPDAIKSFGQFILQHIFRKKERIPS